MFCGKVSENKIAGSTLASYFQKYYRYSLGSPDRAPTDGDFNLANFCQEWVSMMTRSEPSKKMGFKTWLCNRLPIIFAEDIILATPVAFAWVQSAVSRLQKLSLGVKEEDPLQDQQKLDAFLKILMSLDHLSRHDVTPRCRDLSYLRAALYTFPALRDRSADQSGDSHFSVPVQVMEKNKLNSLFEVPLPSNSSQLYLDVISQFLHCFYAGLEWNSKKQLWVPVPNSSFDPKAFWSTLRGVLHQNHYPMSFLLFCQDSFESLSKNHSDAVLFFLLVLHPNCHLACDVNSVRNAQQSFEDSLQLMGTRDFPLITPSQSLKMPEIIKDVHTLAGVQKRKTARDFKKDLDLFLSPLEDSTLSLGLYHSFHDAYHHPLLCTPPSKASLSSSSSSSSSSSEKEEKKKSPKRKRTSSSSSLKIKDQKSKKSKVLSSSSSASFETTIASNSFLTLDSFFATWQSSPVPLSALFSKFADWKKQEIAARKAGTQLVHLSSSESFFLKGGVKVSTNVDYPYRFCCQYLVSVLKFLLEAPEILPVIATQVVKPLPAYRVSSWGYMMENVQRFGAENMNKYLTTLPKKDSVWEDSVTDGLLLRLLGNLIFRHVFAIGDTNLTNLMTNGALVWSVDEETAFSLDTKDLNLDTHGFPELFSHSPVQYERLKSHLFSSPPDNTLLHHPDKKDFFDPFLANLEALLSGECEEKQSIWENAIQNCLRLGLPSRFNLMISDFSDLSRFLPRFQNLISIIHSFWNSEEKQ